MKSCWSSSENTDAEKNGDDISPSVPSDPDLPLITRPS
jgi:hypothetical protein